MSRPDLLVVVAGTATEIGKTWVTARTCEHLRAASVRVAARKPAQSFDPGDVEAARTDAHVLAAATADEPARVCPPSRWYPVPMAPPMAAEVLDRDRVLMADLVAEMGWPEGERLAIGFVETAGGAASPIAHDGDAAVLAKALRADVAVLIADAGLGTISAVRLAAAHLNGRPVVVVLNRYDPADALHRANLAWLTERDCYQVVTGPSALARALIDLLSATKGIA